MVIRGMCSFLMSECPPVLRKKNIEKSINMISIKGLEQPDFLLPEDSIESPVKVDVTFFQVLIRL